MSKSKLSDIILPLTMLFMLTHEINADELNLDLRSIDRFDSEAAAAAYCKDDAVVWADQYTTFYYPKFLKQYGSTAHGAYACYKQAKEAGYWGIGSSEGLEGSGREFPLESCVSCF